MSQAFYAGARMKRGILLFILIFLSAPAAAQCERVGAETCLRGAVYVCTSTGATQNTWILRNPYQRCEHDARSIDGEWGGSGHQSPVGSSGQSEYPIVMTISGNSGTTEYPSLGCSGALRKIAGGNVSAQFSETVTRGRNCINGTITVNLQNSRLAFTWTGSDDRGTGYTLIAVLERSGR